MNCAALETVATSGEQIGAIRGTWCNLTAARESEHRRYISHAFSTVWTVREGKSLLCLRACLTTRATVRDYACSQSVLQIDLPYRDFIVFVIRPSVPIATECDGTSHRPRVTREPRGLPLARTSRFARACRTIVIKLYFGDPFVRMHNRSTMKFGADGASA